MRVDVITLFPELIQAFLPVGVTRRAYESGLVEVHCWNPRDFAEGHYRRVDDRPFGGGPGMVMLAQPLADCVAAIRTERGQDRQTAPLIYFSPVGQQLSQNLVGQAAASAGAILLCGRYEGVDQRFIETHVDLQISLGDFVLSGGELCRACSLQKREQRRRAGRPTHNAKQVCATAWQCSTLRLNATK